VLFHADRRRIGGCGHFRSRDKDGGHSIPSAISENPMLYANFTTLSFIDPELLPIEILHCGNREFCVFLRKMVQIITSFAITVCTMQTVIAKEVAALLCSRRSQRQPAATAATETTDKMEEQQKQAPPMSGWLK